MSALADLSLQTRYRTGDNDLVEDLYLPCLARASEYDRAVGYFTSGSLKLTAPSLVPFVRNNGKMRLVVSPYLSRDDIEAIVNGYRDRDIVATALCRELSDTSLPSPIHDTLSCLSWLIANHFLEVRVAVMANSSQPGLYHEKIGLFRDRYGTCIAFQGSANESVGGLAGNFESVLVFSTAKPSERPVADQLIEDFEQLWDGELGSLKLFSLPDAAKQALLKTHPPENAEYLGLSGFPSESPQRSNRVSTPPRLRGYQEAAMASWFRSRGKGVFEMATGTGKTIAALATGARLAEELAREDKGLVILIICPFQHLVTQWMTEASSFGFQPIACFRERDSWHNEVSEQLVELNARTRSQVVMVATNATFATDSFQRILKQAPRDSLVIADEVHNLGATSLRASLPSHFRFRLGLSATPERHRDSEGTSALRDYFGGSVFELGLKDAIEEGALTPYHYSPVQIQLEADEIERYLTLSDNIARRLAMIEEDDGDDEILMGLLIRRARLIGAARGKLPRLVQLLETRRESTHNLIYCGDGRIEGDSRDDERQVEAVVRALGSDLGMAVNRYTSDVALEKREHLRDRFASGALNALVAIKCLDEGVDIPETRRAFILASSTNPRQFIQRRGRVLRPAPGKNVAEIFDFIVVPPESEDDRINASERRLIAQELSRVIEFAGAAANGPAALGELRDLRSRFNLVHLGH